MSEGPDVKIYVGPEKRLFTICKARICNQSAYFRALFNGGFKEGSENIAYLEKDDAEAFDVLVQWLDQTLLEMAVCRGQAGDAWHLAFKSFCLAEKTQFVGIQADIISMLDRFAMIEGDKLQIELRTIVYVRENVLETTKPYQYILETVAKDLLNPKGRDIEFYDDLIVGPCAIPGFAKGLIRKMKNRRNDLSQR